MEEKLEAHIDAFRIQPSVKKKIENTARKDGRPIKDMIRIILKEFDAESYLKKRDLI